MLSNWCLNSPKSHWGIWNQITNCPDQRAEEAEAHFYGPLDPEVNPFEGQKSKTLDVHTAKADGRCASTNQQVSQSAKHQQASKADHAIHHERCEGPKTQTNRPPTISQVLFTKGIQTPPSQSTIPPSESNIRISEWKTFSSGAEVEVTKQMRLQHQQAPWLQTKETSSLGDRLEKHRFDGARQRRNQVETSI